MSENDLITQTQIIKCILLSRREKIVGFLTKWKTLRSEISMSFRATIQIKDKAPLPQTLEKKLKISRRVGLQPTEPTNRVHSLDADM